MTIKLKNLNKSYGKKPVLFDINLEIPTGSFTMLRGVSGSGKSTLLSIIGGIEPMTSGQVLIDDQDVSKLKGGERADFYRHVDICANMTIATLSRKSMAIAPC